MSVGILNGEHGAVLYCNTSMWAFGPVFNTAEDARLFKSWLSKDPRELSDKELREKHTEWLQTRGIDFASEEQREAFADWLSKDFADYNIDTLGELYKEWKQTVWNESA